MYKRDVPIQEIADKYNNTYKYIYSILTGHKRMLAYEKYHIEPPIKADPLLTADKVRSITFKLVDSNSSIPEVAKEFNLSLSKIRHIQHKTAWTQETEGFDFKNHEVHIFDDSPEIDQYSCDSMFIGDTEYTIPDDWKDMFV